MKQALNFNTTCVDRITRAKVLLALPVMVLLLLILPGKGWGQPNFYEEFNYVNGTPSGTNWTSNDPTNATVQGNLFQLTSPGDDYSGVIWTTSELSSSCTTTPFYIDGNPINNSASGDVYFEYSLNGSDWLSVPSSSTGIPGTSIYLRLRVENIDNTETVTLDDVIVWEGLTVSAVKTDITCFGVNDGKIEATADCGKDNNYSYQWHCDEFNFDDSTRSIIENLEAGTGPANYWVTVSNVSGEEVTSSTFSISEPAELNFTYNVLQAWSCPSGVGCNGSIEIISVTGGTNPVLQITGGYEATGPTTFSDLCPGTYNFSMTDDEGCPFSPPDPLIISPDNDPPYDCDYPEPYSTTLTTFEALSPSTNTIGDFSDDRIDIYLDPVNNYDTIAFSVDASNYINLNINIWVTQSDVTSWNNNDSLSIYIDYDGELGLDDPVRILSDHCVWNGTEDPSGEAPPDQQGNIGNISINGGPISLSSLANNNSDIVVYVFYKTTDYLTKTYTVNNLVVSGTSVQGTLNRFVTGEPLNCIDDYSSSPTANPNDGNVTFECDSPQEFWFERTWTVTDDCGNETNPPYVQLISVGAYPVFDETPRDTIIDYCNRNGVSLPVPDFSDGCGGATMGWEVTTNSGGASPASGTGTYGGNISVDFDAPVVEMDTTYVITWTITDGAGLQTSLNQNIEIKAPINISISPATAEDANFCSGEEATFDITITGGTGIYDLNTLSISDEVNNNVATDGTGQFIVSITWVDGSETITISISDDDDDVTGVTGGCPSGDFIFTSGVNGFTVHQLISTGTLNRVD